MFFFFIFPLLYGDGNNFRNLCRNVIISASDEPLLQFLVASYFAMVLLASFNNDINHIIVNESDCDILFRFLLLIKIFVISFSICNK